ncbi:MAG: hypothetical protein ACOYL6_06080 [Bacteriovoracaceae bacterium]
MKKLLLLTILLCASSLAWSFEVPGTCADVSGTYSISKMVCQGQWSNVYLVLNDKMFTGIFDDYETVQITQKDCHSISIKLSAQKRGVEKIIELPKFENRHKIKMKFSAERIRMQQGNIFKRFVASFEKVDEDLVLTNEYGPGFKILEIMKQCQLPRVEEKP